MMLQHMAAQVPISSFTFFILSRWKTFVLLECLRKQNPSNGKIECESKRYALASKCYLSCDPGYIPLDLTQTTCIFDEKLQDFVWDIPDDRLKCIKSVSFVIGGMLESTEYTNNVEVFSPNVNCNSSIQLVM